ncbi:MAG: hypothetical protein QOE84_3296 [Actinomycetota bacterium]|jgi:hypothetical protein|nr:hypothetical protein [Actinomycetota bacterium]
MAQPHAVVTELVVILAALVLLAAYVTWTAGRLDRLHARVDAAWAGLDAQLVRRAAAARALVPYVADPPRATELDAAAHGALEAGDDARETVENDLSRALRAAVPTLSAGAPVEELRAAASRVALARSFHNAAVNDTRTIRWRRIPRLLRLAGHRAMPAYFEIDDTALAG